MENAANHIHLAAIWWMGRNHIKVSVRTTREDVDLSVISKKIIGAKPGGGHPKA